MKIQNKTIGKRILAALLSLLTVLSCMTIGFAPAYALDSTAKEWNGHHRFSVDGKDAYCINYGKASNGKFETNAVQIVVQVFCNALKRPKINNFSAQKNILKRTSPPTKNNPKLVIIGNSFGFSVYIDTR